MADQALRSDGPAEDAGRSVSGEGPVSGQGPGRAAAGALQRGARAAALPPATATFVGRRAELRALLAEIDTPGLAVRGSAPPRGSRVLIIAGRPGSGRTALAVHLAREVAGRYPDGALFARLSGPGGEPVPMEQTARELLRALHAGTEWDQEGRAGPSPSPSPSPAAAGWGGPAKAGAQELCDAVRGALAGRRSVLVLDDAIGSEQVLDLLPDTPDCLVVVVSDGPLTAVADARPCVLGGLDSAAAVAVLTHAVGSTRITCDPRAADALTQECAGHPTALRLVSGWLAARPRVSVADAVRRLREAAAEDDKSPSAPLARAFRLAHQGLPPTAARLLRLLVLAPSGVVDPQLASALAGCSVRAAASTLEGLAAQGLLLPEEAPDEYRVPGCLDGMLRELLETCERAADVQLARARMLERTVRLLGACRAELDPQEPPAPPASRGPRREPSRELRQGAEAGAGAVPRELRFTSRDAAEDWLHRRLPTLIAAARSAVGDGGLDNLARRLIAALVRVLSVPGGESHRQRSPGSGPGSRPAGPRRESTAELYQLHGLVLDLAQRRGRHRERAAALINLADLDVAAGRCTQALDRYRAALTSARADDDTTAAGRVLESIGNTHRDLGDFQRAVDWYLRALAVRESRGELGDQARLHGYLGAAHARMRHWGESVRSWRAAVSLHRRANDMPAHARALTEVARVLEYAGQAEESLRTCREALRRARHLDDVRLEAAVLLRMADTLERLGDPVGARVQREQVELLLAGHTTPGRSPVDPSDRS